MPLVTPARLAFFFGALLGVVSGMIALGEAFVFEAPGGASLRGSLYLILGGLLVLHPWATAVREEPPSLAHVERQVAVGIAGVLLAALLVGLALGEHSVSPDILPPAGAAACGWAGAQVSLLADGWGNVRGRRLPRVVALLPVVAGAAASSVGVAGGHGDAFWRGPWPLGLGSVLGALAVSALVRLERRHGSRVLTP